MAFTLAIFYQCCSLKGFSSSEMFSCTLSEINWSLELRSDSKPEPELDLELGSFDRSLKFQAPVQVVCSFDLITTLILRKSILMHNDHHSQKERTAHTQKLTVLC